jgi:sec-independent protein translocase protein TatC
VYAAIILVSPLLIYEFWAFVGPAFTSGERQHIVPVVATCTLLFLGGVVFGYLIVLPRGLQFLLGWNAGFFHIQNRAQDYLSFVAWFLVAFGAVFEMPVIIVAAVRMGIIDVRFLTKNRKYALLINAVIAAVVTPSQDAFSMMAMLIPLVVLYEVAIVVARVMQRRRAKALAAAGGFPDEPPRDGTSPRPA